MNRFSSTLVIILTFCFSYFTVNLQAQELGNDIAREEMVINAGAPSGYSDVLNFLPDGSALLAAGEDKRVWRIPFNNGNIHLNAPSMFRWPIYREQRGMVYCMAMEPGEAPKIAAIAGFGFQTNNITFIDLCSGETLYSLKQFGNEFAIWSVSIGKKDGNQQWFAFGNAVGEVFVKNLFERGNSKPRLLGMHASSNGNRRANRVMLVEFIEENKLISLAQDGSLIEWSNWKNGGGDQKPLGKFEKSLIHQAVVSPNHKWVAAVGNQASSNIEGGLLYLANLRTGSIKNVPLPEGYYGKKIAFDIEGKRIAIGAISAPESVGHPYLPVEGAVIEVDVNNLAAKPVLTKIKTTFSIDGLAYHPNNEFLAVAGGDNFEISIWNTKTQAKVSTLEQQGKGLWQVAFSKDGKSIGIRDQRNPSPTGFNDWGTGKWNVFQITSDDNTSIGWKLGLQESFEPVTIRNTSEDGWSVEPTRKSLFEWNVNGPQGQLFPLPLDPFIDQQPRCYTFLKSKSGIPTRLIVGHFLGASLFELDPNHGVKKTRIFAGHAGTTTSLSVSPDEKVLVTCSRDGTVAAYSLLPWKIGNNELGASFVKKDGQVLLQSIDAGSPFWEMMKGNQIDLKPGEPVKAMFNFPNMYYDPTGYTKDQNPATTGIFKGYRKNSDIDIDADAAMRILREPRPRNEMVIEFDQKKFIRTFNRQMPVWKLFCARNENTQRLYGGEWILWRWRDYYYACSTRGDDLIGWQVTLGLDKTPLYYSAEKFRGRFNKPEKVLEVLSDITAPPDWITFNEIMPPKVSVSKSESTDPDTIPIQVTIRPEEAFLAGVSQPERVTVWLNDHRLPEINSPKPVLNETQSIHIPKSLLRAGDENVLTVKVYGKQKTRNETVLKLPVGLESKKKPNLYGLLIGISDYTLANQNLARAQAGVLKQLASRNDLSYVERWLLRQQDNELYDRVEIEKLEDHEVSRAQILSKVESLRSKISPDDVVIIFLAGHGLGGSNLTKLIQPENWAGQDPSNYLFPLRDFNPARPAQTAISERFFADQLSNLPGRKIVFFDACHSSAGFDIMRELTPENIGPAIFASCEGEQESYELNPFGIGLFTNALVDSTKSSNLRKYGLENKLTTHQLFRYLDKQVPSNCKAIDPSKSQNPVFRPAVPENKSKFLFGVPGSERSTR